jgi:periplasmic divalent cation tolerance protein
MKGSKTMTNILVFLTTATKQEAQEIVQKLLGSHLIACANIMGPVESQFWWKGKIDKTEEYSVLMKSDEKLFEQLSKAVKEVHSYEVPEILAIPIVKGWQPYLDWLNASLQPTSKR